MPSRFLSRNAREELDAFPSVIDEQYLITYFLLTTADLELISTMRGEDNRLGVAVLICSLRYLGFFPTDLTTIPHNALLNLAEQMGCPPEVLANYGLREQTRREHMHWVRVHLGFNRPTQADLDELLDWLTQRALENERPSILLQQASERLYKQRLVRPGITVMERLMVQARLQAHDWTYDRLAAALDESLEKRLDALLKPAEERNYSVLSWLRRPVTGSSADDILIQLEKLAFIQNWELDDWPLSEIPPARLDYLTKIARRSSISALEHKVPQQRYPLLMAFLYDARAELTDNIIDMVDRCVADAYRDAHKNLKAYLLQLAENQQQRGRYFNLMAHVILDPTIVDPQVRATIFAQVTPEKLQELLDEDVPVRTELDFLNTRYGYFRRFFPALLDRLTFHALNPPDPLSIPSPKFVDAEKDDFDGTLTLCDLS